MKQLKLTHTLALLCLILFAGCSKNTPENPAVKGELVKEYPETAVITGENFDRQQLIRIALENMKNSYAPYSNFNVSAAVVMGSGKIYNGVNVENSSYGATICAERTAITHAIASGEKKILGIAIVGGMNQNVSDYCAPCGVCRQVMREFCNPKDMHVIIAKSETDYKDFTLEELLPESFGPESLN